MDWDAVHRDKEMDSDMHFCVASGVAFKNVAPGYSAKQRVEARFKYSLASELFQSVKIWNNLIIKKLKRTGN